VANIIRFRGEKPRFLDAFETFLSTQYAGEDEEVSIIACGPMVPEAMRAAWLLKEECGLETRVINMHTVKPLDVGALVQAAEQTRLIVTAEEHQVGGFGNIVAGAILQHGENCRRPLFFDMVGVNDRFGLSGKPWELVQEFGLSAEYIAQRVLQLQKRWRGREERASAA
jgi:transketolase